MGSKNITLLNWAKSASDEEISRTRTTRGYLKQIAYGHKTASVEMAPAIERETRGLVTRKQLRPDDWALFWPELAVTVAV
jgi:DNA-binding transcriptional regulator YdaS (Cro superfamily)